MHSQLLEYFSVNKILSSQPHGFIPNRSTETAALEPMDRNITAMNYQLTPINIYLDLSKAFDSIDHKYLQLNLNTMVSKVWRSTYIKKIIGSKSIC